MIKTLPAAVIFDMDGVLTDTEPLHGACFIEAFSHYDIHITLENYRRTVTIGGTTVRDYYILLGGDESNWTAIKSAKDKLLTTAMQREDVLMPGVVNLLNVLKYAGIPTAVATSARKESLNIILNSYNLQPYFNTITTKDEVNTEKPSPEVFLLAAQKLRVDPVECVVMEDSPRGVLAAQRANMKCIAIPTQSTADGDFSLATRVIGSLEDVDVDMLRGLF